MQDYMELLSHHYFEQLAQQLQIRDWSVIVKVSSC